MAGIDYTIPGQFKGIQLESPMNVMAQAMQLRGLQDTLQLNALKAQEYQQQQQEKNALAQLMADTTIPYGSDAFFRKLATISPLSYESIASGVEKRQTAEAQQELARSTKQKREQEREEAARKFKEDRRGSALRYIANAQDFKQAASLVERAVRNGDISREEADDMLAPLYASGQPDMGQFRANVLTGLLPAEKVFEEQRASEKQAQERAKFESENLDRNLARFNAVYNPALISTTDKTVGAAQIKQRLKALYAHPVLGKEAAALMSEEEAINQHIENYNQNPENYIATMMNLSGKDIYEARQKSQERTEPKWEYKKVGSREVLVDVNPYSSTVGQMKPYAPVLEDTEPKWELRKVGDREVLVDTNPNSSTVGQMKAGAEALVDTEPKWVARDIGGSIVYVDENRYSETFGQQKSGASITKTAPPAAPEGRTTEQRNYDAAKDGGFTGTFAQFLDQQKETADEREWRKAVANGTFKGTFIQWKQALRPVSNTNVAAPVQTVTVMGPDGKPELRDARTGRRITDDRGQPLVPFDASNKPLSPAQAQKLKKDQSVDNARITVAKDTADDIERNVDSLIGNEKKKIKPHKGLPGITGFNALLPSMPGGDARGAQQLLDNIKGKVTMMGKSIMSQEGKLGNMAVQEWKIVSDAVEKLDAGAPNFADQLRNVVRQARRLENNLRAQHKTLYEAPTVNQSSSVRSEADAILDRK